MGLFHLAELFGMTIRESANDGSDFSNPSADYRRLFLGEDGQLHVKDSSGTVTDIGSGGSGIPASTIDAKGDIIAGTANDTADNFPVGATDGMALVVDSAQTFGMRWANQGYDIERRTAGDLTINSTSAGNAFPTIGDNVVAAAAGDLLLLGLSTVIDSSAGTLRIDVATIVSASPVNYVSSLSGTPATAGLPNWRSPGSVEVRPGGGIVYVVQSGDISGGTVTLRLCGWVSSGSKNIQANTGVPLVFWVRNLGH